MAYHCILPTLRVSLEITVVSADVLQARTLSVLHNYTLKETNDEKFTASCNFLKII